MKRVLIIGGLILVALLIVAGFFFVRQQRLQSAEAEAEAPATVVTRGSIEEVVSATGNVVAAQQASLTFASSGEIAEVLVDKGQQVELGEILARVDTTSLEWQIARSQASLETAQARLAQAQKPASAEDLASARAALDSAIANYDRVKAGPSAEDLASAQAALDSALANYDKVKAGPTKEDLAAAQAAVDQARASLRQAQAAYDRIKNQPDVEMRQESLNLQNATISLGQAQANYDAQANRPTESELAAAEAQVVQARASLASLQDNPSDSDLATAESQVAQAQASLNALLERPNAEDVAVQQAQVEEATLALAQSQSQLEDALLRAPFAGAILAVNVSEGEWASPGAPAMVLAATEPLILSANVDEVDVAQLAQGQMAHLSFDALDNEGVIGTVTYIAPSSTNVGGAVAYAIEVSFSPDAPSTSSGQALPVRLGMTADVDVVTDSAEDALLVPNRAIEADRQAGRYYVNRQRADGTTERLEVIIGLRDEVNTQILEGLQEGDIVVLPKVPEQTPFEQQFGPPGGGGSRFGGGM
jgi:RND family efflux transporter MFP subunit